MALHHSLMIAVCLGLETRDQPGTYLLSLGHYVKKINTAASANFVNELIASTNSSHLMASVNGLVIWADNHLHRIPIIRITRKSEVKTFDRATFE